jgi:hypothetical protein
VAKALWENGFLEVIEQTTQVGLKSAGVGDTQLLGAKP